MGFFESSVSSRSVIKNRLLRGRVGRTRRRKRLVRTSHGKTSEYGKIRQKSADFGMKFFRALQCSVSWDNFTRGADEIYTVVQQWAGKSPITATICSPDSHSSNKRRNDPMFVYQTPSKSGDLQQSLRSNLPIYWDANDFSCHCDGLDASFASVCAMFTEAFKPLALALPVTRYCA